MKPWYFLLFACACSPTIPPPSDLEMPPPGPVQVAVGSQGKINWQCEQNIVNPALVWVECVFINSSKSDPTNPWVPVGPCLKVSYVKDSVEIAESRIVCSGPLDGGESSTAYIAFAKDNRIKLNVCDSKMESCIMSIHEEKNPLSDK